MRSKSLNRILEELTPEKEAEMRQKKLEYKEKLTAELQLGYYVGEKIVSKYLPTLSTDMLQSRKVIKVSEEDEAEHARLDEAWLDTTQYGKNQNATEGHKKEAWDKLLKFRRQLEQKYLPNPLRCHIELLNIQNEEEFKKGLISSLWNCDMCSYDIKPENIKIYDDENLYFTVIELKLDEG